MNRPYWSVIGRWLQTSIYLVLLKSFNDNVNNLILNWNILLFFFISLFAPTGDISYEYALHVSSFDWSNFLQTFGAKTYETFINSISLKRLIKVRLNFYPRLSQHRQPATFLTHCHRFAYYYRNLLQHSIQRMTFWHQKRLARLLALRHECVLISYEKHWWRLVLEWWCTSKRIMLQSVEDLNAKKERSERLRYFRIKRKPVYSP